jgi:DNA (cytosine-5)-methyltransferase 1
MSRQDKVMVRIADNERSLFEHAANEQGLPIASWARMSLIRAARGREQDSHSVPRANGLELLSLFCGPGGLDEGFRQAGFSTRMAFDNDQECVNTFKLNHANATVEKEDIRNLTAARLDQLAGTSFKPVGIIGGPPCQSFSISNVHQSDEDPRHDLPMEYARLLKELNKRNPISFFLFENVPGLLGRNHQSRYELFKRNFMEAGFDLHENMLDAINYGVPQIRPRVFIVGINRKFHPRAVWNEPAKEESRPRTVREVIGGLPEPIVNSNGLNPDEFPVHPNHWTLVPRSSKFRRIGMLKEGQMIGRSYRTLKWDEPSWTVAYGHREVHVHPNGKRRISIYEAMLFQTFPRDYRLTGNITAQVRLISEAVPVRLAWHLAVQIRLSLGI